MRHPDPSHPSQHRQPHPASADGPDASGGTSADDTAHRRRRWGPLTGTAGRAVLAVAAVAVVGTLFAVPSFAGQGSGATAPTGGPSATAPGRTASDGPTGAGAGAGAGASSTGPAAPTAGGPAAGADCSAGRVLTVVAHADDDLLFDGTELRRDVDAGRCVRSVVVTAGDAGNPAGYWRGREQGLLASYASLAGVASAWTASAPVVAGAPLRTETLTADPRLSVVFLQLPDGNVDGTGFAADRYESLQQLYQGSIDTMHTVTGADHPASYTLRQLETLVTELVRAWAPTDVHTLDHAGHYGDGDHSDHHTVAYLTDAAQRAFGGAHTFSGWLGYPIADRPSNLTPAQTRAKGDAFFTYSAHDPLTCASVAACSPRPEGTWLSREYAVGSPATPVPTPGPTEPPGDGTSGGGSGEPAPTRGSDVTGGATVTASSDNPADGQTAAKAVDGVVSGYPDAPTAEWATRGGGVGSWLRLDWAAPVTLGEVDLADRPNPDDRVTGGTLTFSDGSTVDVPALDDGGAVQRVSFTARSVRWVRFTVTGVSATTRNVGLAEARAFAPAAVGTTTPTPTLRDRTDGAAVHAAWDDPATGQTAAKAVDGVVSGYPDDPTAEWVAPWGGPGVWIQLDWSAAVSLRRIVLADRPNTADRVTGGTLTFSDGSSVRVGALPDSGTPTAVDFTARTVTWARFTVDSVSPTTVNPGLAELRAWGD